MNLVIVESPTKCKTIKKYLGSDFEVMASKGHIRDLSTTGKGGLGVDIENDFKPKYINDKTKLALIKQLKDAASKADKVYLATDPDREGEAISWHLCEVLGLDEKTTPRLEFHEITKPAIAKAMENPRTLDMSLVQSQETRRIIDRIMGFKLSGLLKSKIGAKSAGRVQSVTLKLITDREKEINSFVPQEYWYLGLNLEGGMKASYDGAKGELTLSTIVDVNNITTELGKEVEVVQLNVRNRTSQSKPPLITSTMQQEAFNKYKYSTSKTAKIAQELYEGIDVGNGPVGLITYMRTDSIRLSPEFTAVAVNYIEKKYGKEYVGYIGPRQSKGLVQDAHEAIRPTTLELDPESIKSHLTKEQYNLYKLIYNRALASLMSPKVDEVTQVKFSPKKGSTIFFKTEGVVNVFDGYTKLYQLEDASENKLPSLTLGQKVTIKDIIKEQKFTTPPSRFNEAKLVKTMEELGIGRPSTYASTLSLLQDKSRGYLTSTKGTLYPTEKGIQTVDNLTEFFPKFMDVKYTSKMEEDLDCIVDGNSSRHDLLTAFYNDFQASFDVAKLNMEKVKGVPTGRMCPKCGAELLVKKGRYGEFVACSNYPDCSYIEKEEKEAPKTLDEMCPECGKPLVLRKSKKSEFIACSGFPKCHYTRSIDNPDAPKKEIPVLTDKICPKCGKNLFLRKGVKGKSDFYGCSNYPKCRYSEPIKN